MIDPTIPICLIAIVLGIFGIIFCSRDVCTKSDNKQHDWNVEQKYVDRRYGEVLVIYHCTKCGKIRKDIL